MPRISRRSVAYPPAEVPAEAPVTLAQHTGYGPAYGALSAPVDVIPRRVMIVAPAYNGAPVRRGLTMPGLLNRPKHKNGYGFRTTGAILDPGDGGTVDETSFGVPAFGNVLVGPTFRPPAPVVERQRKQGITTGRIRQMRQVRRLSALLPNPGNFWTPQRYGEDYDGTRGGGGAGDWTDTPDDGASPTGSLPTLARPGSPAAHVKTGTGETLGSATAQPGARPTSINRRLKRRGR